MTTTTESLHFFKSSPASLSSHPLWHTLGNRSPLALQNGAKIWILTRLDRQLHFFNRIKQIGNKFSQIFSLHTRPTQIFFHFYSRNAIKFSTKILFSRKRVAPLQNTFCCWWQRYPLANDAHGEQPQTRKTVLLAEENLREWKLRGGKIFTALCVGWQDRSDSLPLSRSLHQWLRTFVDMSHQLSGQMRERANERVKWERKLLRVSDLATRWRQRWIWKCRTAGQF